MATPLKLSRLPKAPRLRSIKFRRTTPGNITRLLAPQSVPNPERASPIPIVDPSHPWARVHPVKFIRRLPCFRNSWLTVHAIPKGLLGTPEKRFQENSPRALRKDVKYGADGKVESGRKNLNMSIMFVVGKKHVHKFSVVRNKIRRKVKVAIMLMVTRDAVVGEESEETGKKGKKKGKEETGGGINGGNGDNNGGTSVRAIVQTGSDDGEKWILQDWTYVVRPSLEVYRMPLPTLLAGLQESLGRVNAEARKLESVWKLALTQRQKLRLMNATSSSSSSSSTRRNAGTQQNGKQQWTPSASRVRALLRPYASESAEMIDDDLLFEESDKDEVVDEVANEVADEEDYAFHSDNGVSATLRTGDRSGLIKTRLPPRRTGANLENEERIEENVRIQSQSPPPSIPTSTSTSTPTPPLVPTQIPTPDTTAIPTHSDTQIRNNKKGEKSKSRTSTVLNAMYSRGPILKPVAIPEEEQSEKDKKGEKKMPKASSGYSSKVRIRKR